MKITTVIQNLKRGNHNTFKDVVYSYTEILLTIAKIYTRNQADAEDVLQDAFISIYRNIHQFNGSEEKAFLGWMKKIVTNAALAKYKKKQYSNEKYGLENISHQSQDPSVLKQFEHEELMNAIFNLPLKYKQIIGLYAINGYSHNEIAELLNIKPGNSRAIYSRGTKMLHSMLTTKMNKVKSI